MSRTPIYVVGYPKSGNSYTSWLLGDILNSPIESVGSAMPLSAEGKGRTGDYVIHQMHMRVVHTGESLAIKSAYEFCPEKWKDERIVYIRRDPRDVAVSSMYYFQLPDLRAALRGMIDNEGPGVAFGDWRSFVDGWDSVRPPIARISYEMLRTAPHREINHILYAIDLERIHWQWIEDAINRQSLENKRKQIEVDGCLRPFGLTAQLRNLRKGIVGDWRNHFNRADGEYAHNAWWEQLQKYGYENDPDWWRYLS